MEYNKAFDRFLSAIGVSLACYMAATALSVAVAIYKFCLLFEGVPAAPIAAFFILICIGLIAAFAFRKLINGDKNRG